MFCLLTCSFHAENNPLGPIKPLKCVKCDIFEKHLRVKQNCQVSGPRTQKIMYALGPDRPNRDMKKMIWRGVVGSRVGLEFEGHWELGAGSDSYFPTSNAA